MKHISKALDLFNDNPQVTEKLFRHMIENMPELNTETVNFDLKNVKILSSNYSHGNCKAVYDNATDYYTVRMENVCVKKVQGTGLLHYANVPLLGSISRSGDFCADSLNMKIEIRMQISRQYSISNVTVRFVEVPHFRVKVTNTGLGRIFERFLTRLIESYKNYIYSQVARAMEKCLTDAGPYLKQLLN